MFGILKKKLSEVVKSISKRFEKKEDEIKKIEEAKEDIEKEIEPIVEEKETVEDVLEKFKPLIEEKAPEMKKDVERAIEKVKEEVKVEAKKVEKKPKEKKSFFKKVTEKILKRVTEKKLTEEDLEPILNELEIGLIEADVAYDVAEKIKNDLKDNLVDKKIKRGKEREVVIDTLRQSLLEILSVPEIDLEKIIKEAKKEKRPAVFIFFGMNGVGKSLSLSKVAKYLKDRNYKTILAAGDTFRAAGDLQLEMYADKIGVPVVKQKTGADPCAVIFDARKAAEARNLDVVLADTSGRMHTKKDLMDELAKIVRVNKPDLKILVLDSLTGSDVINQFDFFDNAVGVDAVIFSKVDVNEKGGNILSICHKFRRSVLFLGVGQKSEELVKYNPESITNNLLK